MHVCCAADLNPWAVLSELTGGLPAAGQQQGATGLWVHQQFEQGRGRVVLYLDRALQPCLLYTSPSPRDLSTSRMPSSA